MFTPTMRVDNEEQPCAIAVNISRFSFDPQLGGIPSLLPKKVLSAQPGGGLSAPVSADPPLRLFQSIATPPGPLCGGYAHRISFSDWLPRGPLSLPLKPGISSLPEMSTTVPNAVGESRGSTGLRKDSYAPYCNRFKNPCRRVQILQKVRLVDNWRQFVSIRIKGFSIFLLSRTSDVERIPTKSAKSFPSKVELHYPFVERIRVDRVPGQQWLERGVMGIAAPLVRDMGEPFGKASACLRVAASAKAGANLCSKRQRPFAEQAGVPLWADSPLSLNMSIGPASEALKGGSFSGLCPFPSSSKLDTLFSIDR